MNLKQMEYFVAAAEQLNFTRAAKKCFISQTAMTLQIRSLEEKIGVPLFVRDKHHVELTAAGKVYLNEARAILVRAEEAAKLARTAAEGVAGELTIGFILILCMRTEIFFHKLRCMYNMSRAVFRRRSEVFMRRTRIFRFICCGKI